MTLRPTEDVRVLNDGLHSKRGLAAVHQLFTKHDLKQPVLYHFIMCGSQDKAMYQATMKKLMQHIRTKCRAEYIGAYEVGEEKSGLHIHAFIIIETAKHFPSDLLDVSEGEWINRRIKRTGLSIRIEPPKNGMHGGAMFARMNTPQKLENCINWATYILKPRSKDGVPGRETYCGSEFISNLTKREAKRQKYRDALTSFPAAPTAAEAEEINDQPNEELNRTAEACIEPLEGDYITPAAPTVQNEENRLLEPSRAIRIDSTMNKGNGVLTAAQRYVARLYEEAVDADLDTDQIRKYLMARGVVRTPGQVLYELENVYEFHGYADSHQPKPVISVEDWDKMVDQGSKSQAQITSIFH